MQRTTNARQAEIVERIISAITKDPSAADRKILKNIRGATRDLLALARGRRPCRAPAPQHDEPASAAGGVPLKGLRVLVRKPNDSAAKFIKRLPAGVGFTISELSAEWGMSEETIRRHASGLGCLRYVETSEDNWTQLVLSPETANHYKS